VELYSRDKSFGKTMEDMKKELEQRGRALWRAEFQGDETEAD